MIPSNEIWQELKDGGSPLADMPRRMPYAVPEDYFGHLSESLAQGVFQCQSEDPLLLHSRAMPFELPQEYFTTLPGLLTENAVRNSEAGQGAQFTVPHNYFEELPQTLLKAAKDAERLNLKKQTVSLRSLWQKKALQWAAAAMLIMGIGIGTYTYVQSSSPDAKAARQLAKLDKDVIRHYISLHVDEFDADMLESYMATSAVDLDESMSHLDEQEIREYLDGAGPTDTQSLN